MIRLMRGQVAVRETPPEPSSILWTPTPNPREVTTHRGVVLALGAPSLINGREVAWGFDVGGVVQFHFEHNEKAHTLPWIDGGDAVWLPQRCVDAVIYD